MFNIKQLAGILLVLAVLFVQVGHVAAAPQTQDTTPLTGTIESISTETDSDGVTTVLVTLSDDQGATQTLRLSLETAVNLGLIILDSLTQEPAIDETQIGQTVEIDPTTVIPEEEPVEESVHPIAALLASFFSEDASVVNGYHEDGFGFGVIAQALWISQNETGDASLAGDILLVKRDKDYEAFFENHPEYLEALDGPVPTNWGQFKKALSEKKNNLGTVVSDQADQTTSEDALSQQEHGNGQDKDRGQGNGKDKGNGKGKDKKNNKP